MEYDSRKFRNPRRRGRTAAPARVATKRLAPSDREGANRDSAATTALAAVIAEVLPQYSAENSPAHSAELYSDLFIDSRRFLMIIRGLERTLGLEIDDEDLLGVDLITYGDLLKFVSGIAVKKSGQSNG